MLHLILTFMQPLNQHTLPLNRHCQTWINSFTGPASISLCQETKSKAVVRPCCSNSRLDTGLVLINSAGLIVKDYKPEAGDSTASAKTPATESIPASTVAGPPGFVADILTGALLFYLERTITRQGACDWHSWTIQDPLWTCI